MTRSLVLATLLLALLAPARARAQKTAPAQPPLPPTEIADRGAAARLLGEHPLSLQWISWEELGRATVSDRGGTLALEGRQEKAGDYLTVSGHIRRVTARTFTFVGEIVTRVSHINEGKPCTRKGTFTFAQKGKRKYWRLQQMDSPCDDAADYVDLHVAPARKKE